MNLDKFIDFAFKMRSNLFGLWELQGLEGRRRLQKLVFPDGFIYDKNNEHIEPKRVNQFFLLKYSYPTGNGDKKKETNRGKHDSSLRVLEAGLEPAQPQWPKDFKSFVSTIPPFEHPFKERAENETRTRDPNLGKVMLYQLSYFRIWITGAKINSFPVSAKFFFIKVQYSNRDLNP